jgi:hypothetical protein
MRKKVHNIEYSSMQAISYNLPFTVEVWAWKLHEEGLQELGVVTFVGIKDVVLEFLFGIRTTAGDGVEWEELSDIVDLTSIIVSRGYTEVYQDVTMIDRGLVGSPSYLSVKSSCGPGV